MNNLWSRLWFEVKIVTLEEFNCHSYSYQVTNSAITTTTVNIMNYIINIIRKFKSKDVSFDVFTANRQNTDYPLNFDVYFTLKEITGYRFTPN